MQKSHEQTKLSWKCIFDQFIGIFIKNLNNSLSNKKKLLGQLIFPLIISAIYIITQKMKQNNPLVTILLQLLLKIYIGLVGTSALRELIVLFITQRTENFRQYQMIFGVSFRVHTLSNLFYMGAYQSIYLLPFYITLNYYNFDLAYILYFGSFVISSCTLTLALTSFFKDHKIAMEIIGMFFSLASFLPFMYDPNAKDSWMNFIVMAVPNSAFTIAILYKSTKAALISLAFVKIYFLIYGLVQHWGYCTDIIQVWCRKIGNYVPALGRQPPNNLMEEFQLNEVVNSQLEQNSILNNTRNLVIKTEGLIKTYDIKGVKMNALNGVSMKIYQSQIFGLLGRNGAGKTTLVDILTGVTKPTRGTFQLSPNSSIGICYQHEILYESLTVEQHLQFYSRVKSDRLDESQTRESHIQEIIKTLGIESERNKKSKQLSGGNKRKLSIAIAIIGRPDILIFDEPTSGLDPLSRIYVWEIFEKLRRMNSTIILTTHHLDEAQKLADWICVIQKGSLIVQNTASQIKQKYGKGFHLEILLKDSDNKLNLADVQMYKSKIQKIKLKAIELQVLPSQVNFLVKPLAKQTSAIEFEYSFANLINDLEKNDNIEVIFHSNTLEQSFIAILRDQQNSSGDSLAQSSIAIRQKHNLSQVRFIWLKQLIGVVFKNFLFQKSNFVQSITIYNINILIVLISSFFNKLVQENTNTGKDVKTSNPMIFIQAYTIMATAFITSSVYQKQKKIYNVLKTRGLKWSSYWLGSFIFDYGMFLLNLLIMGKLVAPDQINQLGWNVLAKLGIAIILYTYCFSHLFEKVKSASAWFSIINMILSIIIMPMILFEKNEIVSYLSFIKFFYPYYDLIVSALFQQSDQSIQQISQLMGITKPQGQIIQITILIYLVLLVLIQIKPFLRLKFYINGNTQNQIINEKIRLQKVSKKFGQTQALNQISYYADSERLALLGHNGAGKSTTFGLLSAQLTCDTGQVYLQNKLRKPWQNRLISAGICYQQDALWEQMTVEEILLILSWIIPIQNKDRQVKWLFQNLQFDPNSSYKRFNNLSGGNKRKICMMFALYGDPSLCLLDQCSTGLDPSSRLAMVETIKSSKAGTTIFTTHSMSQAEDLCTKSVIMSKGRLLEFQYISRLRSKYFDCCWIELQLEENQNNFEFLSHQFVRQGVILSGEGNHFKLEMNKKLIKKSQLLQKILLNKEKRKLNNFSWIQPRLQDVYIKVTRESGEQIETLNDRTEQI